MFGIKIVSEKEWNGLKMEKKGYYDAKNEMIRMEELEQARKEVDKTEGKKPMKQNMFKVV